LPANPAIYKSKCGVVVDTSHQKRMGDEGMQRDEYGCSGYDEKRRREEKRRVSTYQVLI